MDHEEFPKKMPDLLELRIGGVNGSSVRNIREGFILKVLVIGDPCVGKTSYVQRIVSGTFHKAYKGTIGVDFAMKVMNLGDTVVKVQLWDIAGQERYTSMTRVYYRDAKACIIMFDTTSRPSFLNVIKWKRDFDEKVSDPTDSVPCLLLANKCDDASSRQVDAHEIEKICTEFNFTAWAHISVKQNVKVQETLSFLVANIIRNGSEEQQLKNISTVHLAAQKSAKGKCGLASCG